MVTVTWDAVRWRGGVEGGGLGEAKLAKWLPRAPCGCRITAAAAASRALQASEVCSEEVVQALVASARAELAEASAALVAAARSDLAAKSAARNPETAGAVPEHTMSVQGASGERSATVLVQLPGVKAIRDLSIEVRIREPVETREMHARKCGACVLGLHP